METIKNEPAVIGGLISAVIALAISFGLSLNDEQVGAIMAVVTIALSLFVRTKVVPTNKIPDTTPPAGPVVDPPQV